MNNIFKLILLVLIGSQIACSDDYTSINPAMQNSFYPRLYEGDNNLIYMSWMEVMGDSASLKYAQFNGDKWSDGETITSGTDWFINWADYPAIVATKDGYLASTWLKKSSADTYSYDIWMNTANKSSSFILHNDSTKTEHGFVSMETLSDSTFMIVWLDGRETEGRNMSEYSDISKAMTLRSAIVDNKGNILHRFLIDDSVCDCCNTSLTATETGFIVFYRDRTASEIRDIKFSEFDGDSWTKPEYVYEDNWEIAACPVNGPSSDHFNGETVISWFTGTDNSPEVKWSIISKNKLQQTFTADSNKPIGRVNTRIHNNEIYLSWIDGEGTLLVNKYDKSGNLIAKVFSEKITKDRNTGFPQIAFSGNRLLIAWTDNTGDYPFVTTRVINP